MKEITQYRKDASKSYLEYAIKHKFLFLTYKTWHKIPKPFYTWTQKTPSNKEKYLNSHDIGFDTFTNMWPHIEDYLNIYKIQQNILEK